MTTFEFPSAGIHVVYRRDDLCLSEDLLRDFEQHYVGRVSERVVQCMLVVAQNVEAIRAAAVGRGQEATFGTWTFTLPTEELGGQVREVLQDSALFRRKLVRLTGTRMTWVVEWGRQGGRIHGHYAADGWQDLKLVEKAKDVGHRFVGRCNIKYLGAPGYMWKEMGKAAGRRGCGFHLMGSHGDFKGRSVMRDFVLDSPMKECRRLAWEGKERGEEYWRIWERGRKLFDGWLRGGFDLGEDYDGYRDSLRVGVRRDETMGDAWEPEAGDVSFEVGDLDSGKGGGG
jgi:hypothetical protein